MKFTCKRYPSLVVMQGAKVGGRFANGEIETTDTELIKILRQHPHIEEVKAKKKGK